MRLQVNELEIADHSNKESLNILIFGDGGKGNEGQFKVAKSMYDDCSRSNCDFAMVLGDNVYSKGVKDLDDPLFHDVFEKPYENFNRFERFDIWTILGNHDWSGSEKAQIEYSKRSNLWRMLALDYAIPNLPNWLYVYGLDTTRIASGHWLPTKKKIIDENWDNQLERARKHLCDKNGWKVLFAHHPIYSTGKEGNLDKEKRLEKNLLPFIKECKIDFFVTGHEHFLEHISSEHFQQIISGSASQLRTATKSLYRNGTVQKFKDVTLGYIRLNINESKAIFRYFNTDNVEIFRKEFDKAS
jgi:acid phosphatase